MHRSYRSYHHATRCCRLLAQFGLAILLLTGAGLASASMPLHVATPNNGTLTLQVQTSDGILQVKHTIESLIGIPPVHQRLMKGFTVLDDGRTLADYNIQSGDTVRLLIVAPLCFVDASATGANDGSGWTDAYVDLQDALANTACVEIWVANGVYTPGTSDTDSFVINRAVAVYGGFAGNETSRSQRDPGTHITILSGDIDDNDSNSDGNHIDETWNDTQGNNSLHVVTIDGTATPITASTVLDGFVITGGNADDNNWPDSSGGGLWCTARSSGNCSPVLRELVFSGNQSATYGGAMYVDGAAGQANPTVSASTFSGNRSKGGGAIFINAQGSLSNMTVTNVTFVGNEAASLYGGAIWRIATGGSGQLVVNNATFSNNSAFGGGAIANQDSPDGLVVTNSIFWGNHVTSFGPAIVQLNTSSATVAYSVIPGGCPAGSTCNNIVTADPLLGTLADNGGFGQTLLPGPGGSAIDAGDGSSCANHDQRGVVRPQRAACDIGAVELRQFVLAASVAGQGNITAGTNPAPVSGAIAGCTNTGGSNCTAAYAEQAAVSLVATPSTGWHFVQWGGDCSGSASSTSVTLDSDKTCSATFAINSYTITTAVNLAGSGSVSCTPNPVNHGGSSTCTATPATGYHFTGWSGDCTGSGACNFTNVTADKSVTANFALNTHLVGGSVTGLAAGNSVVLQNNGGDDLTVSADGSFQFTTPVVVGQPYAVTVLTQPSTPAQTCTVANGSGSMPDADVTNVSVTCATVTHTVTGTVGSGNGSIAPASQSVAAGSTVTLTVTPDTGWHVASVTGCGGSLTGTTYTTGSITADCTVTASFAINSYTVSGTVVSGHGSITPATAQADYGDVLTFTISPDSGWLIQNISGCGGTLSGNIYTTGPITADCAVTVRFAVDLPAFVPVPMLDWRGLLALVSLLSLLAMAAMHRRSL